ncbi:MAG: ferredoxin-thioredoxin reductase catalytic domain-containing protein [Sulfurovaceae bacterium]|nr:ferredoxin-thioredoxin reductase catalytic domain-containing protein [Sulfurovaceae bacterium]
MLQSLDMSSPEFLEEIEKTKQFTYKVCSQFGFVHHPNEDVNEGVIMGLARHKMLYGKRFCPCFMVIEENGMHKSADNRICPCKPALDREIPEEGKCHCGIFCTPEYAMANQN